MKNFSIAIDGPGGAGKSTIARAVAEKTKALYLDTGAMYRTVGLAALRAGIDMTCDNAIEKVCENAEIDVRYDAEGVQRVYLNNEDVSLLIREPQVSEAASRVSAVVKVRERLVEMQRAIAADKSVIMDGRDIGTRVLPNATVKIFLSADAEVRARRRYLELQEKGRPDTFQEVYEALVQRDKNDSTRAASPLEKAWDAVELDTTNMTLEESVQAVMDILREKAGILS